MLSDTQVYSLIKKSLYHNDTAGKACATFCLIESENQQVKIVFQSEKEQKISGVKLAESICKLFFQKCSISSYLKEGAYAQKGENILSIQGPINSTLECKETILYYLTRMIAITDKAHSFYNQIKQSSPSISLTEGNFWNPDIKILEKYACEVGGAKSYKRFFQKSIIINSDHLLTGETITSLINKLEERLSPTTKIQVHPSNLNQVMEAADKEVDSIVLKGLSKAELKMALHIIKGRSLVEVSGDLDLKQVKELCQLPINFISTNDIVKNSGFAPLSTFIKKEKRQNEIFSL